MKFPTSELDYIFRKGEMRRDILLPKQARYRAAPRPDKRVKAQEIATPSKAPKFILQEPGTPVTGPSCPRSDGSF